MLVKFTPAERIKTEHVQKRLKNIFLWWNKENLPEDINFLNVYITIDKG